MIVKSLRALGGRNTIMFSLLLAWQSCAIVHYVASVSTTHLQLLATFSGGNTSIYVFIFYQTQSRRHDFGNLCLQTHSRAVLSGSKISSQRKKEFGAFRMACVGGLIVPTTEILQKDCALRAQPVPSFWRLITDVLPWSCVDVSTFWCCTIVIFWECTVSLRSSSSSLKSLGSAKDR